MPLVQESLRLREQQIRREQCARLVNLGEKVYWVRDEKGVQHQMVLLKSNGTLFALDITLGDWLTLDGTTLTKIHTSLTWPYTAGSSPLSDKQVTLPSFDRDMPGDYMNPRYGFTNQWLRFVQERRASAAQAPSGSSGPGPNLGGQDVAMSSLTVSLKVVITAGGTWTPAPRAVTIAPVSSVDNPSVAPIQQVAAQTLGPAQCICNCFCQWSTDTSATLTYDHATGVSFCCAHYCWIFVIHTSTYFECHSLNLNLNLRNLRFNYVQTNFCFYKTIQYGNKLNLSYVSINGIGSIIASQIDGQLYKVWSSCESS